MQPQGEFPLWQELRIPPFVKPSGRPRRWRRWEEAILLQKKLWSINWIFQKYSLAPCIKACLEIQGFPVGDPILPLQPLTREAMREVEEVLKTLDNLE
jgi:4-hydroxy-tetrahydrodipicolinate synthase